MAVNDATYALSFHEILTKVNNKKDKPGKLEVLRKYDTNELRMFLKGAFSPKLVWLLPEGKPPFKKNEAPIGTEHTWLKQEVKRMFHFLINIYQEILLKCLIYYRDEYLIEDYFHFFLVA